MTQQNFNTNWLKEEADKLTSPTEYEELPPLKLVPNVIAEFDIDISKPWNDWKKDEGNNVITHKKIIPVVVNGTRLAWWVNVKNPIYREIVTACTNGITHLKVMQTGTLKNTRYNIVK